MSKRKKILHFDWHHRKPRSLGGKDNDENMSHVSVSKHRAWHNLFKNYSAEQIVKIINDIWIDPEYKLILQRRNNVHTTF